MFQSSKLLGVSLIFGSIVLFFACNSTQSTQKASMTYPETRKDTISDDYHGTAIADPYRWLEDDYSDETKDWVQRQNALTDSVLDQIPFHDQIEQRLTDLYNYERYGTPFKKGDHYYYFKNDGLQNQSVFYRINSEGDDVIVLDPNTFSEDGTTSLGSVSFSEDGKYMAYQISEGGSDWRQAKVMDMESLEVLDDELDWIKFSGISWYNDGFFYSRYPAAKEEDELSAKNQYHSLYYHQLGDPQTDDLLIYRDQDHPQRNVSGTVDDSENFLILSQVESTSGNSLKMARLGGDLDQLQFENVVDNFDHDFSYVATVGDQLLFTTNQESPNQKALFLTDKDGSFEWKNALDERDETLQWLTKAGDYLVAGYLKNASSQIEVFDTTFNPKYSLELPGIGTVGGFQGNKKDNIAYYAFTSFTYPTTIYRVDLSTGESTVHKKPTLDFDFDQYETIQEWYTSKDGTKIPMFITQKKGLKKAPTLLYGYGGFDISVVPSFSISNMILLENGGRYVVANIRGGGEFGKEWHKAGTLGQKQNVFDDFIAASEYLINKEYTNPDLLAIEGGSNGGLLVGACMTQRPELYQVVFPRVGVLDMLRYHQFTIGWAWATDYGRSDDPAAFEYLIKYSPLHNVDADHYPSTMIMTADHDDRVVPAHSFKFAAELQDKQQGDNPILIRIETSAGHGAGKSTSQRIKEEADKWSFMFSEMNQTVTY